MTLRRYAAVMLLSLSLLRERNVCSTNNAAPASDQTIDCAHQEEGLKRSQVMEDAQLLSDVIGPRLTASPNMKARTMDAR